jgi:hypothetical protein
MLATYRPDPRYALERSDLAAAFAVIHENEQPGDAAAVHAYLRPAWYYTFNHGRLEMPWYSLPLPSQPHPHTVLNLFPDLRDAYKRVWLLVEVEKGASTLAAGEDALGDTAGLIETWQWDSDRNWTLRLALYELR